MAGREDGDVVAERDRGHRLVVRLSERLTAALADATDERLLAVVKPWSETEEFAGRVDLTALAEFLRELALLARGARIRGAALYCYLSV